MSDPGADEQRRYYDRHFAPRASIVRSQLEQPLFLDYHRRLARRLLAVAPAARPLRLVEVACGEGLLASALLEVAGTCEREVSYLGIDVSESAIELARGVLPGQELDVCDAAGIADRVPPGSVDLLIAKNLLHHLDEPSSFLRAATQVLSPAGVVVAVEPTKASLQAWVFSVLAPRREQHWLRRGAADVRAAVREAGLAIRDEQRFSALPYELAFAVRFRSPRRLLRPPAPWVRRIGALDDRLAPVLPNYRLVVAGTSNQ